MSEIMNAEYAHNMSQKTWDILVSEQLNNICDAIKAATENGLFTTSIFLKRELCNTIKDLLIELGYTVTCAPDKQTMTIAMTISW